MYLGVVSSDGCCNISDHYYIYFVIKFDVLVMISEISIESLQQLLRYDPETGLLMWLFRPRSMFDRDDTFGMWNTRFAGKPAFTAINNGGYHTGRIHKISYKAHRVVWALHHGAWPKDQIDHINGVRTDNRIINLRGVVQAENKKNQKVHDTNISGHTGVRWFTQKSKWEAYINVNRKKVYLGLFDTLRDAVAARAAANIHYGFHPNHGVR
jgi:hypothetical protein